MPKDYPVGLFLRSCYGVKPVVLILAGVIIVTISLYRQTGESAIAKLHHLNLHTEYLSILSRFHQEIRFWQCCHQVGSDTCSNLWRLGESLLWSRSSRRRAGLPRVEIYHTLRCLLSFQPSACRVNQCPRTGHSRNSSVGTIISSAGTSHLHVYCI